MKNTYVMSNSANGKFIEYVIMSMGLKPEDVKNYPTKETLLIKSAYIGQSENLGYPFIMMNADIEKLEIDEAKLLTLNPDDKTIDAISRESSRTIIYTLDQDEWVSLIRTGYYDSDEYQDRLVKAIEGSKIEFKSRTRVVSYLMRGDFVSVVKPSSELVELDRNTVSEFDLIAIVKDAKTEFEAEKANRKIELETTEEAIENIEELEEENEMNFDEAYSNSIDNHFTEEDFAFGDDDVVSSDFDPYVEADDYVDEDDYLDDDDYFLGNDDYFDEDEDELEL